MAGAGVAVVETEDGSDETVTLRAARLGEIRYYTADDTWNKPADLDFAIIGRGRRWRWRWRHRQRA